MLDNAVLHFGTIIENKLQETDEVAMGSSKSYVKRYTLHQLLDDDFTLPDENEVDGTTFAGTEGLTYDEGGGQ